MKQLRAYFTNANYRLHSLKPALPLDKPDIFEYLCAKKGTKTMRDLVAYSEPKVETFTSTAYWQRHIEQPIPIRLFHKAFKLIANFDVQPKIKEHLL